jgi:hypothetical protein
MLSKLPQIFAGGTRRAIGVSVPNKFLVDIITMEFDRPVFQYPPIGADGAPVPCVTIADFNRLIDDALYWRQQCIKERDRILATNCLEKKPNVICRKVAKTLRMFFSDMRTFYIEERRRRSAVTRKCQRTSEVQNSKLLQRSGQLQTDINVAQNMSPSGVVSTPSAPQIHFPMIRQRFTNSSAIISFG